MDTSSIKSFIFLADLLVSGPIFPQGSACSSEGDYKTNQVSNTMSLVNSQEGLLLTLLLAFLGSVHLDSASFNIS